MPQRRHLEPPGWRTATQSARRVWSAAGSEPSQHANLRERSRYDPRVARQIGRGQTEVGGRKVTFPVEVPREGASFEVNKSGRVDPSMSPICASPKFRPNSLVELLGHEIHTCHVHQGWCQGSVLQFKTGESTLGADQPLAFSRNLKLWNLSGKLRKVQTPFKELHHWQTLKNLWGLLGKRELYGLWHHTGKHNSIVMMSDVSTVLIWRSSTHALDFCVSKISQPRLCVRPFFTIPTPL